MKLAIIPARSGSTRIPDKNIRSLLGRPAMAYALDAARDSGLFDQIHVSTDSEVYAGIAADLGYPVSFLRPPALAENTASLMDVLRDTVETFDQRGQPFDDLCLIYATAVLLDGADLRRGHQAYLDHGRALPVMSVVKTAGPMERVLVVGEDGVLRWRWPENRFLHSQHCQPAYFDAGAFLYVPRRCLGDGDGVLEAFVPVVLPASKVCDINVPEDLDLARTLLLGARAEVAAR
jgi:N-acylneuraminate cytidylyltransferase